MTDLEIPIPARVVDRVRETHDVVTLWLQPLSGDVPEFEPAQFSMIGHPGLGEVPVSISSPTSNRLTHGFTIRAAGAVTQRLCNAGVGEIITMRGPMGRPWDLAAATGRHALFVAGGLGIAPLRAAIEGALDDRDRFEQITVLLGATAPPDVVFRDWLEVLRVNGTAVGLTVDRLDGEHWPHGVGLVTELIADALDGHDPRATTAFICGPDPMMAATTDVLESFGVERSDIQVTLERNMYCGYGTCGHCQLGRVIVCRDGPVFTADQLGDTLRIREL